MVALLEALSKAGRRRAPPWVWGAAAIAVIGAGAALARGREGVAACTVGADPRADVWSAPRQVALREAMRATGAPYWSTTFDSVQRRIDAWIGRWQDARTAACRARAEGSLEPLAFDQRMACLDRQRGDLRTTLDALLGTGADGLAGAVQAVSDLPSPATCADPARRGPVDPAAREAVDAVRRQLVAVEVATDLGEVEAALGSAYAAAKAADGSGDAPTRAEAWLVLGRALRDAGRYAEAEDALARSYHLALGAGADETASRAALALVYELAMLLHRPDDARKWLHDAEILEARLGTVSYTALAYQARLMAEDGELEAAREVLQRSVQLAEAEDDPLRVRGPLSQLSAVDYQLGRLAEAREAAERARDLGTEELGKNHPDMAQIEDSLGAIALAEGNADEALTHMRRSLAIREARLGPEHPQLARSYGNLGSLHATLGDMKGAAADYERAVEILERGVDPDSPALATTLLNLGQALWHLDRFEDARVTLARSLALVEQGSGPDSIEAAITMAPLGATLAELGRLDEAEAYQRRAVAILEGSLGHDDPQVAYALVELGGTLGLEEDREQELVQLERALAIFEHGGVEQAAAAAGTRGNLAAVRYELGDHTEAADLARRSIAQWEQSGALGDAGHLGMALPLVILSRVERERGQTDAAIDHAERALRIREDTEVGSAEIAEARFALAQALAGHRSTRARAFDEARRARDEIAAAEDASGRPDRRRQEVEAWLRERSADRPDSIPTTLTFSATSMSALKRTGTSKVPVVRIGSAMRMSLRSSRRF